jgi:hypothetical protein
MRAVGLLSYEATNIEHYGHRSRGDYLVVAALKGDLRIFLLAWPLKPRRIFYLARACNDER